MSFSKDRVANILNNVSSKEDRYCDGYGLGYGSKNYIMGLNLAAAKVKNQFFHEGSNVLDQINAFDLAETKSAYLGQINMIKVSSFCGIDGAVWGYHMVRPKNLYEKYDFTDKVKHQGIEVPIFSADPLIDALIELFGTVNDKKFILKPGSHVPCASKNIKSSYKSCLFVAGAIGIAENDKNSANLMMEDIGVIKGVGCENFDSMYKPKIINNIAKSIIQVGMNQGVKYKEVFASAYSIAVEDGEVGCALVACPYFYLAKGAFVNKRPEELIDMTLEDWKKQVDLNIFK